MLKELLIEKNLSVYKLAKETNLPYTTVNELVLGKKNINECNVKTIKTLATYFNYSTDKFIDIITNTYKPTVLASTWVAAKHQKYEFPVIQDNMNYEAKYIHPLKQKIVNIIYDKIKDIPYLEKLILFGSSITICCNKDSDLDFAILLKTEYNDLEHQNEISEIIQEASGYNCDILWLDKLEKNTNIYNNVQRGVTIYE